jgi:RNA polymerase sigma-70 factor (ECF subfamily)
MKETQAYTQTEPMPSFCKGDNVYEEMNKALRRCRASFIRNAYRFLNNEADAEDAVQDALLSAYKHIDQFRGEAQMSTWLNAIVSNSARMQLRKRQRQTLVSLDEPIGEEEEQTASDTLTDCRPDPEDEYRESELHAHAEGHVAQLSPPLRKVFELRVLDGLSANEAARILGVPNGRVKMQLARARGKLRRLMWREARPQRRALRTYTTSRTSRRESSSRRRGAYAALVRCQDVGFSHVRNGGEAGAVFVGRVLQSAAERSICGPSVHLTSSF